MTLSLGIYEQYGGALLYDLSYRASNLQFSTGEHGFERLSVDVRLDSRDAFQLYGYKSAAHIALRDVGGLIWEGRLEDVTLTSTGVQIAALGYWRALSDVPYTALWSKTTLDGFRSLTLQDRNLRRPEKFSFNIAGNVTISLNKNEAYTTNTIGSVGYQIPDGSSRDIVGISFQYEARLPTQYNLQVVSFAQGFNSSATSLLSQAGSGSVQRGACHFSLGTSARSLEIGIAPQSSNTYTSETGDNYIIITHLRIVTSTTNRINTTLTANRNAGTNVTATVGSTTGMYVGMELVVGSGNANSEIVTVLSIGSSTQFNATFANNHTSGQAVQGFRITADEIARDVLSHTRAINPYQLSSTTDRIQSPGVDLLNESYEDVYPADILKRITAAGDNATPPRRWEIGVYDGQKLHMQPVGTTSRTWYVDTTDLQLARTLEALHNSAYTSYRDTNGRTLRGSTSASASSVALHGVTRRVMVDVDTTSLTQANVQRDAVLNDRANPPPRATVPFDAVYDRYGFRWPLYSVRAGDRIVIRNIPVTVGSDIERVRTFRVAHTDFSLDEGGALTIEPETPPNTLEFMLIRKEQGL